MNNKQRFGALLKHHLAQRKMTQQKFAEKVKISPGFPSNVIKGRNTPPLGDVERWANALRLSEGEKFEFHEAALLAHSPDEIALLLRTIRSRLAKTLQQNALIVAELERQGIDVPELRDE